MAPPSMASMPLMGITPQVSNESVTRSFGQEHKRSSVTATIAGTNTVKATTPTETPLSFEVVKAKICSQEEIARHRSENDAWIAVDGKVYDVTQFLRTHPGGQEVILDNLHTGDAGNFMRGTEGNEGHSHSKAAFKMLQQFQIGTVEHSSGSPTDERMKKDISDKKKYTVDLARPIVAQVGYLGADYHEWVHDPIVCKESPRFFQSDISEFFTRTKWWVIPLTWVPVGVTMEVLAVKNGVTYPSLPVLMVLGAVIWSLVEYVLHRFLFHMKTSSFWGNTFHYVIHGFHHKHPMDGARLVFPPAFTAVICIIIWVALGSWLAPYHIKLALYGAALLTYVGYDLTHYFLHFGTAFSEQSRRMKRYHLNHHFKDQANGYGITTTAWDRIFSTLPNAKVPQE